MENLDTLTKLATNFAKKFTHIWFSCGTGELIIRQHINQEPHAEILHHLQRFASLFKF